MLKFTLDTNCLIDVDEKRAAAPFVKQLLDAASTGAADVAMVASSASERQRCGSFLENVELFIDRMKRLGFGHIPLLPPLLRYDVGFWDAGLWADDAFEAQETLIYSTMFPNSPKEWVDFAVNVGADPEDETSSFYYRWRNQILDAQAFWAHEHHGRDVFVTSDKRFTCLMGKPGILAGVVDDPCQAANRLTAGP